jgi:hypothetical protein
VERYKKLGLTTYRLSVFFPPVPDRNGDVLAAGASDMRHGRLPGKGVEYGNEHMAEYNVDIYIIKLYEALYNQV